MSRKRDNPTPMGYCAVIVCYSNIYHECLTKLLRECSESQGECKSCPVELDCKTWWDSISGCTPNCSKVTAENFPHLVLQFLKFRDKAREKSHSIVKTNGHLYQKELASVKS